MNLRCSFLISAILHLLLLLVLPSIETSRVIHITLPIEVIPYIPPEEPKVEEKKETIRAEKIKVKKPKKVEEVIEKEKPKPAKPTTEVPAQPISPTPVSVTAADFPFTYYLRQVRDRVAEYWITRGITGHYLAVVYFKILRNGEIRELRLKRSSGDPTFDRTSLIAVESASPFPPLPQEYDKDYLGVYFEFQLKE